MTWVTARKLGNRVPDNYPQEGYIVDIDTIQAHGINVGDISKLKANGYYTIASVHAATRRNLLKIKGFSEIKVEKVKDALAKCQVCHPALLRFLCALLNVITAFWRRLPDCSRTWPATKACFEDINRQQAA